MNKIFTLKEFLKTGRFVDLDKGLIRSTVIELIGEPPDWMVARRNKSWQRSSLWKYGYLQIGFTLDDRASWLLLEPAFDEVQLPYEVDGFYPKTSTTIYDFQKFLLEAGIEYQDVVLHGTRSLIIEGKVHAAFGEDGRMIELITVV